MAQTGRSTGASGGQVRVWRPSWPCPVGAILRQQRRGGGDPTYRIEGEGPGARHWRGIRTPTGPATLMVQALPRLGEVVAEAWGPGADWALGSVPGLLGAHDDPCGFEPRHPVLVEAQRRHPHWRIGRSERVFEALVPSIVEQKVTGKEAFAGFRSLVHFHGERAPGPGRERKLWIQPSGEVLRRIPSWEWLRLHIDPARSRAIVQASRVSDSLDRITTADADAKLRSLPGVGVWTSAEVRQRAFGDADAVSFGDYHVAKDVGWALLGRSIDDAELAELLEEWRPHRGRVQAYVAMAGLGAPRRGPRMSLPTHLPSRIA
ncbi:DNA-3-methyladenine glycosylase family protein [Nocardioides agariphilus]|uniref:DNA-3-methyladenine glycosylase family protein n=1 Tax=Nocardioides agariphilus TaxID=433664 RepID=UPI00352151C2